MNPETIPLASHGLLSIQRAPAGFTASYRVRIGRHERDTGNRPLGPYPTRAEAVQAAAGDVLAWAQRVKVGGDYFRVQREVIVAASGLLPLELAGREARA